MKKIIFVLIFISFIPALYALKSFTVLSRGMVRDNSTGLYWTRCPLTSGDKPIYDFMCSGEKKLYTWDEAVDVCRNLVHEGRSDWRLPNIKELQSIVFHYHYITSEINYSQAVEAVFPNAVKLDEIDEDYYKDPFWGVSYCNTSKNGNCYQHYWSSTSLNADSVWVLNIYTGGTQWDVKTYDDSKTTDVVEKLPKYKSVRCVAGP